MGNVLREAHARSAERNLCRGNSPLVGPDAPTPARIGTGRPMGHSIVSGGDPKGVQGGERKATLLASWATTLPQEIPSWRGLTRRLRRGLGLAVPRGAHTFLSVAKEKCAKESQRHGDSGKKPFIAHFDGGARYVARSGVGQLTHAIVRARSSPFSAVKMGGPFSLRCLSPLCSPAVGVGQAYPLRVGMLRCGWKILRRE